MKYSNTIKLLRIPFSFFLLPVFLLALSQSNSIDWPNAIMAFIILHFLVYPASNGYNSYNDKDQSPIGGLEHPPLPDISLYYTVMALDVVAVITACFVNFTFAILVLAYILASRAYSSRAIRLKKYPILGFLVVIIFQGGFTLWICLQAIQKDLSALSFVYPNQLFWLFLASSFQIAGAYPLTQIYQHEADKNDGVKTISMILGYRGTFLFTVLMFIICNACYYIYFLSTKNMWQFYMLQSCFLPVLIYFGSWALMVFKDTAKANFKKTMLMNIIAATSMNFCFLLIVLINIFH